MNFLIYILIYPLVFLISYLPFGVLYIFSDILYFVMYHIAGYRKATVRENLHLAFPEKSEGELKIIEKKFYKHFADLFVEMIKAFHISIKQMQKHYHIKNPEIIDKISAKNQNVIVVSGHYANWEWIVSLGKLIKVKPIATYLKINNPFFEKMMLNNRQRFDGKLIETKQLKKYLKTLTSEGNNFVLGLLADQSPQLHRSRYWRKFLGVEVPVFVGPEKLAKEYDAGFVFMTVTKIKRGYYEIYFEEITTQPNNFENYKLTDIYLDKLEKVIRRQPEFYLWTHRRFKHKDRKHEVAHLIEK